MRSLIVLLLWLLLAPALLAQERRATVTLEDGRTLTGRVVDQDIGQLTIEVDGKVQTIASSQMRKCKIEVVAKPTPPPEAEPEIVFEEGVGLASQQAASSVPEPLRGSLFGRRLVALDRHYPWLSPTEPLQWISLGISLFVFAAFALHFASRIAGTEVSSFGRSVGLAFLLLLAGVAQVALVPLTGPGLFGMLLVNTVVWVALLRFTYELPLPSASIAYVLLLVFTAVGFGILEAVDAVLLSMGSIPT